MSATKSFAIVKSVVVILSMPVLLGGCSYDYWQRTDRVAYHAGNAVKANLERETIDPSKTSMDATSGLGKNGPVIPDPAD